jgi:hypothetical protein
MRKFTKLISCAVAMILFTALSAFGQIPPEQKVVVIDEGIGTIETVINGDTLAGGVRANPTRIYELKAGKLYTMTSPILFGGGKDSTSTLIIVGQEGDKKPFILSTPKDGGDMFTNIIRGSLKLKNLYWPTMATNSTGNVLFRLQGTNQRLEIEDFIHENQVRGDVIALGGVKGEMDIFLKNCYFRDMTQFANPWNYAIFTRGDKNGIDTLWMENVTVANGGLLVMNKYCPVNFAFFNHNTIQNIPRYWNFMEQWKEAYFTNNVFINCLWMGEMTETMLSQLQSQTEYGPVEVGLVNLMHPDKGIWELAFPGKTAPTIDDVKFMASNNLNFTSPYLDKYYTGGLNEPDTTGLTYPVSKVDWGFAAAAGLPLPPHQVVNIPARFTSNMTDTIAANHDNVKIMDNHIQVDPKMATEMIESQEEGDMYGMWAKANFNLGYSVPDRLEFTIGDYNPQTIPGPEGENGSGMKTVMDLPEDFTYSEAIVSKIDGLKLGAQEWYGTLEAWDSEAQLAAVKKYYEDGIAIGIEDAKALAADAISLYPNPANNVLNIVSASELNSVRFYDVTGRMVKLVDMKGDLSRAMDVADLNNGIYILQVEMLGGGSTSSKFIKK